jgi:hypothetical protein
MHPCIVLKYHYPQIVMYFQSSQHIAPFHFFFLARVVVLALARGGCAAFLLYALVARLIGLSSQSVFTVFFFVVAFFVTAM